MGRLLLIGCLVLVGLQLLPEPASAAALDPEIWEERFGHTPITVVADEIWGGAGEVLVLQARERITIPAGITLTIAPGTIIKMGREVKWDVRGSFIAQGTAEQPIRFTSLYDDTIGGDVNGDGDATAPLLGDWGFISVGGEGSRLDFDYVSISYGGNVYQFRQQLYPVILVGSLTAGRPQVTIRHSSIINNGFGLKVSVPSDVTVSDSNLYNDRDCPLPDWQNEIEEVSCLAFLMMGPNNADVRTDNVFWGNPAGPMVARYFFGSVADATVVDPRIQRTADRSEPWEAEVIEPEPEPPGRDPVIIVPGILGSWEKDGEWLLDPILHTYDNLWEAFVAAGYVAGEDLFAFPYNWRHSNVLSAWELKKKIDAVQEACGCAKVDIVAHSMGGLVTRYYATREWYGDDIDQLVFLGTPHRGAPKAYLMWEGGDFFGSWGKLTQLYFKHEAHARNAGSLVDYIQDSVPSVGQLLPDYQYLKGMTGTEIEYNQDLYPSYYPYNDFLIELNNEDRRTIFDNRNIRLLNVAADNQKKNTISEIVVQYSERTDRMWQHGEGTDFVFKEGDETVPKFSSLFFDTTSITSTHSDLPTDAQELVLQFLNDDRLDDIIRHDAIARADEVLIFQIFSPADMLITAPDGTQIGTDSAGAEVNGIPGAFYSGNTSETEFITIPNPLPGEYSVALQGTGMGTYTISATHTTETAADTQEFTATITPGATHEFTIAYSPVAEADTSGLGGLVPGAGVPVVTDEDEDEGSDSGETIEVPRSGGGSYVPTGNGWVLGLQLEPESRAVPCRDHLILLTFRGLSLKRCEAIIKL